MSARARPLLIGLLVVELAVGGYLVVTRLGRPPVPQVDVRRLPPATAAAIRHLESQADSDRPAAWRELGEAYLAYGYLPEGEVVLARAVALDETNEAVRWMHARCLERLGRIDEAIAEFERVASGSDAGRDPDCWQRIGKCQLRAEQPEKAIAAFEKALPSSLAEFELARVLLRTGRVDEGMKHIEQLRRTQPLDIFVETVAVEGARLQGDLFRMAVAEERAERGTGEMEQQREWKDLELIRSRYGLMAELAECSAELEARRAAQAVARFETVLQTNPPEVTEVLLTNGLQMTYLAQDLSTASRWVASFEPRLAISPLARHILGEMEWNGGSRQRAREWLAASQKMQPKSEVASRLAELSEDKGSAERRAEYRSEVFWLEGVDAYRIGSFEAAEGHLQEAARRRPQDPLPEFYRGEIALAQGEWSTAEKAYGRAIARNPHCGRAHDRLRALASRSGSSE